MCDDFIHPGLIEDERVSRRAFALLVAAAAGTAGAAAIAPDKIVEKDVEVKTSDGTCDAALFYPSGKGKWPAVLVWPDIMGLRPAFRDMGRRLASQGYVVLVPNPFYRSKRAPVVDGPIDFGNPDTRKILMGFRGAINEEGIASDGRAHLAYLDSLSQTSTAKKAGVQGYCMGGEFAFRTAATLPARIGAVGSFHGGNSLVSDKPNSPHLLIPSTRASFLIAQAQNDNAQKPELVGALKTAFDAAHRPATVEVYPADHGWCVPGGQVYNPAQAERAWAALSSLYKSTLA